MKILLDECMPADFRHRLAPPHDAQTVAYKGWKGVRNGQLLALATADAFDAFITLDASIASQHNAATLPLTIVILHAKSNRLVDLDALVSPLLQALNHLASKSLVHIRG